MKFPVAIQIVAQRMQTYVFALKISRRSAKN